MAPTAYIPERLFTGESWLHQHAMVVANNFITAIVHQNQLPHGIETKYLPDALLAPAFIDLQIYGANGKLLSAYPTIEALKDLYNYCIAGGAALFQPTVATNTSEVLYKAIDAVRQYKKGGGQGVIGLHIEGPWISTEKRGAHLPHCIHVPTVVEARELLERGKGIIGMITLAPEVVSDEIIELIQSYGVVVSAGHSNATFAQANAAFDKNNITVATHLYNAMSALQHREPGLVGALLLHPTAMASIIPDGHHVDYAAIRIAKGLMGERLFAITDAVTENNIGDYQHQLAGDKYEAGGILSGSALTMHAAFKNLVQHAGIAVDEALRMCSLYPAKAMGLHNRHGRLAPGFAAQAIVLSNNLDLLQVISG